jgi:hypothetical protein
MKKINYLFTGLILSAFLFSCSNQDANESDKSKENSKKIEQWNITILLDLSDRLIKQSVPPSQTERDLEVIKNILMLFREKMKVDGAYASKHKIRLIINPLPNNKDVTKELEKLNVDLSELSIPQKKRIFDSIVESYSNNVKNIYDITLSNKNWIGSDIWRFFKDDVKDICIEKDSNFRNILVVLTDGYIYHQDSKKREGNRTSYLTPVFIRNEFSSSNWKEKIERQDYGFIKCNNNLNNLEILVLEVNPVKPDDADIIKLYLSKWFDEMDVKKYAVYVSDVPVNTSKKIKNFFFDK